MIFLYICRKLLNSIKMKSILFSSMIFIFNIAGLRAQCTTVTVNAATICTGSSATLTASGDSSYTWFPATGLNTTTGATVVASPSVTTTYTVTYSGSGTLGPELVVDGDFSSYIYSNTTGSDSTLTSPSQLIGFTSGYYPSFSSEYGEMIFYPYGNLTWLNPSPNNANAFWVNKPAGGLIWENNPLIAITPNTNYTFSFFVNEDDDGVPNLYQLTINGGTPVATFSVASASVRTWVQFSTVWNSGSATTADIKLLSDPNSETAYTAFTDFSFRETCNNTSTTTVTVNKLPVVTANASSNSVCAGSEITLTGGGASSYTWTGGVSNGVSFIPATTTAYTVTGTDTNGCSGIAVDTIKVIASPTLTVSSATICNGQNATLTANGASSYIWSTGATTASISVSPAASKSYTVTGKSSAGCAASAVTTVTVLKTPTLTVTPKTICEGTSTTLTASGPVTNGTMTYTWFPTTGLTAPVTGATVVATPTINSIYSVTGKNSCGTSTIALAEVTVLPKPIVIANPVVQSICAGSTATLTAMGNSSGYTWLPATFLNKTTGATVIATPTITTTYTVTGTGTNGCFSKTTTSVIVNPVPVVKVNAATICAGTTATLTATGALNYSWSPAAALNKTNGATVIASPTVSTTYTITGTNANGCISKTTTSIIVNPVPVVKVNAATICAGTTATLTATGAVNYTWLPAASLNKAIGAIVIASPTVSTTYSIIGTNANGCIDKTTTTVLVHPSPVINVNSATICTGTTATLTATGAINYSWSPAASLNKASGATVIATPTVNTIYTVTGLNSNGCSNKATSTVSVKTQTVSITGNTFYCTNDQVFLAASTLDNYQWYINGNPINPLEGGTLQTTNYTPLYEGQYPNPEKELFTVKGMKNGCAVKASVTITLQPNPTITITASKNAICSGEFVTLTAQGAATQYNWTGFGAGFTLSDNPASTRTYMVTGFLNGCSSTATQQVKVLPAPTVTANSIIFPNIKVLKYLIATASGGTPGYTYSWYSQQSPATVSSTQNPIVVLSGNFYRVVVTDANGCKSNPSQYRSESQEANIIEPATTTSLPDFMVYPNPNSGTMALTYSSISASDNGVFIIYDLNGKEVAVYHLNYTETELKINDVPLLNGTYFYKVIINGNEMKSDKIVILK